MKVCENLTYTELTDSSETVTAYQFDAGEGGGSFLGSTDGEEEAGEMYVEAIPAGPGEKTQRILHGRLWICGYSAAEGDGYPGDRYGGRG